MIYSLPLKYSDSSSKAAKKVKLSHNQIQSSILIDAFDAMGFLLDFYNCLDLYVDIQGHRTQSKRICPNILEAHCINEQCFV